jgi:two-component system, chemotaxis family, protein-glutamate methylesterase/glutaminase
MPGRDIIVVGASAGGVEALTRLVKPLPADLPASLFVVLHLPVDAYSALPTILTRAGPLSAVHPRDGETIERGRIYVAPPDHHLLLHRGLVRLIRGPRENGHRPAVDPLFRAAAAAYGPRVVGIVLSGALDDGTAGLLAIKARGGVAVVQDPADALFAGMPEHALESGAVDYQLAADEMAPLLDHLARAVVERVAVPASAGMRLENELVEIDAQAIDSLDRPGQPSVFTCPECHGTLWEMHEKDLMRFRCRVGHAYSAASLAAGQKDNLEVALWTALRVLEERLTLSERLAGQARERGHRRSEAVYVERQTEAEHAAALIRDVLERQRQAGADSAGQDARPAANGKRPRAARSAATHPPGV